VQRALQIAALIFDPADQNMAEYYNQIGYITKMQPNPDLNAAQTYYQKALDISIQVNGRRHPTTAEYLNNIGLVYEVMGEFENARTYVQEGLEIDEESQGPQHTMVAVRLNNLGRILRKMRDPQGALLHHNRAREIYEAEYGLNNVEVAVSLAWASNCHVDLGNTAEASRFRAEADSIMQELFGERPKWYCELQ